MGADIEEPDDQDQTPLFNAACGLNEDICQILLEKGANTQSIRGTGPAIDVFKCLQRLGHDVQKPLQTVPQLLRIMKARVEGQLHPAVKRGNVDWILMLLDCGAAIEELDDDNRTPLYHAACGLQEDVCKILLEKGANTQSIQDTAPIIDVINLLQSHSHDVQKSLQTVPQLLKIMKTHVEGQLHSAVYYGAVGWVVVLLDCGADIEEIDFAGCTPLMRAVSQLDVPICTVLLGRGANTQVLQNTPGWKGCIHKAIDDALTVSKVRLLIDLGADIEEVDSEGRTPVVYAASRFQQEICEFLLESGACVGTQNSAMLEGCIHKTIDRGYESLAMIRLLVKLGADIEELDAQGRTPLIHAACRLRPDICKFLLESGAGVGKQKSAMLKGCIHETIGLGYESAAMIRLLVKLGADIEELDSQGRTPLIHAACRLRPDICKFLLESGAGVWKQKSAMLTGCIH